MTFGEGKFPSSEMLKNVRHRPWALRSQLSKWQSHSFVLLLMTNIALWQDLPGALSTLRSYMKSTKNIFSCCLLSEMLIIILLRFATPRCHQAIKKTAIQCWPDVDIEIALIGRFDIAWLRGIFLRVFTLILFMFFFLQKLIWQRSKAEAKWLEGGSMGGEGCDFYLLRFFSKSQGRKVKSRGGGAAWG